MSEILIITNGAVCSKELTEDKLNDLHKIERNSDYGDFVTRSQVPEKFDDFKRYIIEIFKTVRFIQFLVHYNNCLVGTWFVNAYNEKDRVCYLSLYLLKEFRKCRVSYATMIMSLDYCFEKLHVDNVLLSVYEHNLEMRKILERRDLVGVPSGSSLVDTTRVERKKLRYTIPKEFYFTYTSAK